MAGQKPQIPRSHLPDDVMLEILTRLSVKSLLRFRCICKSWNSNITNPYFIATHLKKNKDRLLYTAFIEKQRCLGVCDEGYNKILEIGIPIPLSYGLIQFAGSRNGLICVVVEHCFGYSYGQPDRVYLWNYSTRKLKTLPSTGLSTSNFAWNSYGFVYDSENDDYKIVRTILDSWMGSQAPWKAEVYSLGSDSWRRINNIDLPFMRPDVRVSYRPNTSAYRPTDYLSPFFGGSLHWLVVKREEENYEQKISHSHMIMSFDVSNEKFRESELPPRLSDEIESGHDLAKLCDYKGKLGLFILTYADGGCQSYISIWVMMDYGVAESWTKSVVVQFHKRVRFFGFTEDGGLVIRKLSDLSDTNFVIRPETSSKKLVVVEPNSRDKILCIGSLFCVTSWKESLVPLCGTNVISWDPEIEYFKSWFQS
ncbi:F-box protein CPR30 [Morella rubra]|uniref:F-box protein CPR30 n=1 Tax=Morella rubra TaxID=262757 RepID=A0A6A1WHV8_9ROSI|nr:F-box protein CPR30 [Morella rubra]